MTTLVPTQVSAGEAVPADLRRGSLSSGRRAADIIAKGFMWFAVVLAAVPLGLVTFYVIREGSKIMSWEFLTGDRLTNLETRPGGTIGPAIVGTILSVGVAALIAIPLGVLGAVYLNEYGKNSRLARTIRMMADVMTGVPSIVMGLFIFLIFVIPFGRRTALAGALALACLMLPVIVRSTEEMLKLVPNELREASQALGARKWRTILTVVLPAAISGITSGSLLAIARAAGETAPVVLVMGTTIKTSWDLLDQNASLPMLIFKNAQSPYETAQQRGWGAALTLVIIVLLTTLIARFISSRYAIKER
jgi:phosphate transport system permease protein